MNDKLTFGTNEICQAIPHRFPFLLVDRVVELEPGKRGRGIKNVTCNEYFFQGHFPQNPIMPGALIIECIAQVAAIVLSRSHADKESPGLHQPHYLLTVEKIKFRKTVVPGDVMVIDVTVTKKLAGLAKVTGEVNVNDEIVVTGELTVGAGNNLIH